MRDLDIDDLADDAYDEWVQEEMWKNAMKNLEASTTEQTSTTKPNSTESESPRPL